MQNRILAEQKVVRDQILKVHKMMQQSVEVYSESQEVPIIVHSEIAEQQVICKADYFLLVLRRDLNRGARFL